MTPPVVIPHQMRDRLAPEGWEKKAAERGGSAGCTNRSLANAGQWIGSPHKAGMTTGECHLKKNWQIILSLITCFGQLVCKLIDNTTMVSEALVQVGLFSIWYKVSIVAG